jgi:hypothetical protein
MPDAKSIIAEAVRLRGEGLSLRAIGQRMGVDQKQVQRWLKAAGDQAAKPAQVKGLDGRSYRVSAPGGNKDTTADSEEDRRRDRREFVHEANELFYLRYKLRALQRVANAERNALIEAERRGLTHYEGRQEADAARTLALRCYEGRIDAGSRAHFQRAKEEARVDGKPIWHALWPFWDDYPDEWNAPDHRLVSVLADLAGWLTPVGLEQLRDEVDDLIDKHRVLSGQQHGVHCGQGGVSAADDDTRTGADS